jgi:FlaG/FlaF family flagellin (archaellin)
MKKGTILLTLAAVFAAAVVGFAAANPNMGTWKLDEAKSKIAAGTAKNNTVVYAVAGDSVKVTVDGVDANGKPAHNEWTGKFDGKDYPVTGDPTSDMRAYRRVDARTLAMTFKRES